MLCRGRACVCSRAQGEARRKPGFRPLHSQMYARVPAAQGEDPAPGGWEPECCISDCLASDPSPHLRWLTVRGACLLGWGGEWMTLLLS